MWNLKLLYFIECILDSFSKECWQIDKIEESETFDKALKILRKQIKMLNDMNQKGEK